MSIDELRQHNLMALALKGWAPCRACGANAVGFYDATGNLILDAPHTQPVAIRCSRCGDETTTQEIEARRERREA